MRHRVVQVGLGVRGKFHLRGLVENPEAYEIVGLCDLDPKKIEEAKAMFGLRRSGVHGCRNHAAPDAPRGVRFRNAPERPHADGRACRALWGKGALL